MIRDGKTIRAFLCALPCNDSAGHGRKTNYFLPYVYPPFLNNNARLCIQFTIYEVRSTKYDLRFTIYDLRFTIYDFFNLCNRSTELTTKSVVSLSNLLIYDLQFMIFKSYFVNRKSYFVLRISRQYTLCSQSPVSQNIARNQMAVN